MRYAAALLTSALLAIPALAPDVLAQSQSAAGDSANAAATPKASSLSPDQPPKQFQPLGSFPTNTVTNRPYVGPQIVSQAVV